MHKNQPIIQLCGTITVYCISYDSIKKYSTQLHPQEMHVPLLSSANCRTPPPQLQSLNFKQSRRRRRRRSSTGTTTQFRHRLSIP